MFRTKGTLTVVGLVIIFLLGFIAAELYLASTKEVSADSGRFDYVYIVSATYLYDGRQGLLLLDKRNGNVWFLARNADNMTLRFADPVFIVRLPFDKLPEAPR